MTVIDQHLEDSIMGERDKYNPDYKIKNKYELENDFI